MSNETYRMQLIAMKTIELSDLIIKTNRQIDHHKEMKKATKHSDKVEYNHHHHELKRLNKLIAIQKEELMSRQMRLFD